jgi:putative toxin-antitoxin system antitoxin component (TIGR02293 family)
MNSKRKQGENAKTSSVEEPIVGALVRRDKTARASAEPKIARSNKAQVVVKGQGLIYLLDIKPEKGDTPVNSAQMLVDLVRAGVTRRAYDKMLAATGLSNTELADLIHISDRTLRRYKPDQTFSAEQSERMVELASLYSRGAEVFETLERFKEWISRPQIAFGNEAPKSYLDTSIGIGMIMDELGRIEHGIFA